MAATNRAAPPLPQALNTLLTVRELQVVRLVAAGQSNANIARELFLSPRTVDTHVSNALHKTGCSNRTELAVLAIRPGAMIRPLAAGVAQPMV